MFTRIDAEARALSFAPVVRPVIALASGALRGAAIDRTVLSGDEVRPCGPAIDRLSAYDAEQLDAWVVASGLDLVEPAQVRGAVLYAPVTYATLSASRGRRAVLDLLAAAQARRAARLALEVTNLDPGLPPSRLIELLVAVKPICPTVLARLRPARRAIGALRRCGLAGAAVEAADLGEPADVAALTRLALMLQTIGPRLLAHSLRSIAAINAARAAGFTYASLDIAASAAPS
jgi:hypothetical protein